MFMQVLRLLSAPGAAGICAALFFVAFPFAAAQTAGAEEPLPWGQSQPPKTVVAQENPVPSYGDQDRPYKLDPRSQDSTRYGRQPNYDGPSDYGRSNNNYDGSYDDPPPRRSGRYGAYDDPPPPYNDAPPDYNGPPPPYDETYSDGEIMETGHRFFGTVSSGLAKVIEYAFSQSGRPNGYILGEEAGGAFVAGLRYGEGILYTKNAGRHRVFWQGPSIGYDFGAEGSKTMILVYNLYSPNDIYGTFAGVSGSAYFIGGVGITFQKSDRVTLAPIRAGVGARIGANVGYLKYTRRPTWNPF